MKTIKWGTPLLFAVLLGGCDAAKEPMAKAREAEAAGNLAEAKKLYADACKAAEQSPFCAIAKQHIDALTLREAMQLATENNYVKLKEAGATITGASAKRAFDALMKTKAVSNAAAFEEAIAMPDKAAARVKMEELATTSSSVADKAKEWMAKNGPGLLLAEVKAACKVDGAGSCVDLGKKITTTYPSAAEAAESQALVEAEYKRLYPVLKQAEGLLVQRLEVYNWQAKKDLCAKLIEPENDVELASCNETVGVPSDRGDPFNTDFLEKAWKKKLEEVHDPGRIKVFEDRWFKIASAGMYDPANLPKPGEKPPGKK